MSNRLRPDNYDDYIKELKEFFYKAQTNIKDIVPEKELPDSDDVIYAMENIGNSFKSGEKISPAEIAFENLKMRNPYTGKLRVQAFTARNSYPVKGAKIVITKNFSEGKYIVATLMTDESGLTKTIILPATSKELTDEPEEKVTLITYDIEASHPEFVTEQFINIPLFEDVVSLQNINFIPKSLAPENDNEIIINETEDPRYLGGI